MAPHDPDDRARSFFEDDRGAYAGLIGQLDLPCRVPIALFPRAASRATFGVKTPSPRSVTCTRASRPTSAQRWSSRERRD